MVEQILKPFIELDMVTNALRERDLMIYGAYGYTGELVTRLAVSRGHSPILVGRNESALRDLSEKVGMPYQVIDLTQTQQLDEALSQVRVVLHCAGPYAITAQPMVEACLRTGTHYLDITGELEVFEWIASQHEAAVKAGVCLLPGVGFDVVPSDCLAAFLKSQLPDATHLDLVIKAIGELSRGTTITAIEHIHKGGTVRRNGVLQQVPTAFHQRSVQLKDQKPDLAISIPWGDVSTAYHSTQIPNITVYMVANAKMKQAMKMTRYFNWLLAMRWVKDQLQSRVKKKITGPTEAHRESSKSFLWGEVKNDSGQTVAAQLQTPEGYKLTAETAVRSFEKIIFQGLQPGFYTPSKAFGADFILEFDQVARELLT